LEAYAAVVVSSQTTLQVAFNQKAACEDTGSGGKYGEEGELTPSIQTRFGPC
jgi:hypothetical protein